VKPYYARNNINLPFTQSPHLPVVKKDSNCSVPHINTFNTSLIRNLGHANYYSVDR